MTLLYPLNLYSIFDKSKRARRRPKERPAHSLRPYPAASPSAVFGSEKEELARRTRTTMPAPLFLPKNRVVPCQPMRNYCASLRGESSCLIPQKRGVDAEGLLSFILCGIKAPDLVISGPVRLTFSLSRRLKYSDDCIQFLSVTPLPCVILLLRASSPHTAARQWISVNSPARLSLHLLGGCSRIAPQFAALSPPLAVGRRMCYAHKEKIPAL